MAFSYAFRLALMISLFEFLAVYFDILAARWLAFTSLAICTPYVDRDIEKAKMRIKGALAGIFIFTAITLITDDYWILTGIMLILNYIYTLYDPLRYDLKMMFTNISALITAVLVLPEFGTGLEDAATRLICILAGTVIVIICNRIIFPYHIHTENIRLGERSLVLTEDLIRDLSETASGKGDEVGSACAVLSADLISEKIRANVFQCPDDDMEMFIHHQSEVVTRCAFYRNSMNKLSDNDGRLVSAISNIVRIYGSGKTDIPSDAEEAFGDLDSLGYECAKGILETVRMYRKSVSDLERYKTKIEEGYRPKQILYAEMH